MKRTLLFAFTLAAFATLLSSPAATQTGQRPRPARVVDVSTIKIPNFGRVNEIYYRGGEPGDGDYAALAALGIRTVIALRPAKRNDQEAQLVEAAGMTFHRIAMHSEKSPPLELVAEFMTMVSDPARQPVYVHCTGGRHRTGVMTAVYRMEHDGWTADQAYQEMQRYKFGWSIFHRALKDFVYRYRPLRTYGPGAGHPR